MAASAQVAVPAGATPVNLISAVAQGDSTAGDTYLLYNAGGVTVGLGNSTVTAASMWRALVPGAVVTVDLTEGEALFGLVPTGSAAGAVDVLRVR